MAKKKARVSLLTTSETSTLESGKIINFMVKVHLFGKIIEDMSASGKMV